MNQVPSHAGLAAQNAVADPAPGNGDFWMQTAQEDDLFSVDFVYLLSLLRRNLLWIAGIVFGVLLLGIVVTFLMTPKYNATAKVLIEQQADQIIEGSDVTPATSYQDADRFLQTQLDILRSRALTLRVVRSENLAESADFFDAMGAKMPEMDDLTIANPSAKDLLQLRTEAAAERLEDALVINLPDDSRLVSISITSADPDFSARLANAFAKRYIEGNLNRKFESSAYAREFLSQQLAEARTKLEESERKLNQYSRSSGLIRLAGGQGDGVNEGSTLSVTNNSLIQVNGAANAAQSQRMAAEQDWRSIEGVPLLAIPQVLSNKAVQDLLQQKAIAEANLAEERARHLDEHPTVLALKAQVEKIDSEVNTVSSAIRRSVYLQYKAALDKETALKNQVSALRASSLDEQDRGVEYNVLRREADTNRALYDSLLVRFNELNATASAAANNVSIVDVAEVPRDPSSPRWIINILVSLVLGSFVAGAFVLAREFLDDSIRAPGDVEAKLGLPLLGLIPKAEGNAIHELRNDQKSAVGEAYHTLVTNLNYSTASGCPKVLVITSSQQSEGKSTTATAIAIDLARLGRRVLLIDGDLRRPTLRREYGLDENVGLSDILAGQTTLAEVIRPGPIDNLSLVAAGPCPPEPSLLLGGMHLPELLDEARAAFDSIIIDSPPMLGLSDTASLSMQADAVLFVVDSAQGHRGAVKSALRRLNLIKARIVGAVLTKFDPKVAGSEYSYYGSSYYRYGGEEAGSNA